MPNGARTAKNHQIRRARLASAGLLTLMVLAGLASRSAAARFLPQFLRDYSGDTLWAMAVFQSLTLGFPTASGLRLAVAAVLVAGGVEFSQLYQAQWLNQIRATPLGELTLGRGFLATDLACYTVGVLLATLLDRFRNSHAPGASGRTDC
ncbi:MAG: DUF2809 domain-containing protein [Verrucomicrobiales bacterium]|nr:DUF2809 domain-containing protein [Verrucomicrobiales bacterium]